jgi:hypothetical protein
MPTRSIDPPLALYLGVWPVALFTSFHMLLLLGLLAPPATVTIFGVMIAVRSLFLPLAYTVLVLMFEVYGYRIGLRLAWLAVLVFNVGLLCLVAIAELPSNATALAGVNSPRLTASVIVALSLATLVLLGLMRLGPEKTAGWLLWARLVTIPIVVDTVTVMVLVILYLAPAGTVVWDNIGGLMRQLALVAALVVLYSPLAFLAVDFVREREYQHAKRLQIDLMRIVQQQAERQTERH